MPPAHTTKIIVRELLHIHTGRSRSGGTYSIWQVRATKPSGERIVDAQGEELKLRTFDEGLPKDQVIEVSVEKHHSEQYGTSYTVAAMGEAKGGLTKRVERIEAFLESIAGERWENFSPAQPTSSAPATTQAAPRPGPPPPPPAPPPQPPADDVPF
jgi:hypothetical protein